MGHPWTLPGCCCCCCYCCHLLCEILCYSNTPVWELGKDIVNRPAVSTIRLKILLLKHEGQWFGQQIIKLLREGVRILTEGGITGHKFKVRWIHVIASFFALDFRHRAKDLRQWMYQNPAGFSDSSHEKLLYIAYAFSMNRCVSELTVQTVVVCDASESVRIWNALWSAPAYRILHTWWVLLPYFPNSLYRLFPPLQEQYAGQHD